MEADAGERTPLHLAAEGGHGKVFQQLLAAAPEAAAVACIDNWMPLHMAAAGGHAQMAQQLLAAAPGTAAVENGDGKTPLALAAERGHTAVVQLLLASGHAAPRPADLLFETLRHRHVDVARCLVAAEGEAKPLLVALERAHKKLPIDAVPLSAEVVARQPLDSQDWQLVPCGSGLAAALPAVLERSEAEAGLLVVRLPAAERSRLRLLALCLSRASRGQLPREVLQQILAACAAAR
jgi:ankyrin repeat protein